MASSDLKRCSDLTIHIIMVGKKIQCICDDKPAPFGDAEGGEQLQARPPQAAALQHDRQHLVEGAVGSRVDAGDDLGVEGGGADDGLVAVHRLLGGGQPHHHVEQVGGVLHREVDHVLEEVVVVVDYCTAEGMVILLESCLEIFSSLLDVKVSDVALVDHKVLQLGSDYVQVPFVILHTWDHRGHILNVQRVGGRVGGLLVPTTPLASLLLLHLLLHLLLLVATVASVHLPAGALPAPHLAGGRPRHLRVQDVRVLLVARLELTPALDGLPEPVAGRRLVGVAPGTIIELLDHPSQGFKVGPLHLQILTLNQSEIGLKLLI
jgi:hypothetical protein